MKTTTEPIKKYYAACSFKDCLNKAEWTLGTWQACDECAKKWVVPTGKGKGFSPKWGSCQRIGQEIILAHNIRFDLKYLLAEIKTGL